MKRWEEQDILNLIKEFHKERNEQWYHAKKLTRRIAEYLELYEEECCYHDFDEKRICKRCRLTVEEIMGKGTLPCKPECEHDWEYGIGLKPKCKKCGKLEEGAWARNKSCPRCNSSGMIIFKPKDLCKKCAKEVLEWLKANDLRGKGKTKHECEICKDNRVVSVVKTHYLCPYHELTLFNNKELTADGLDNKALHPLKQKEVEETLEIESRKQGAILPNYFWENQSKAICKRYGREDVDYADTFEINTYGCGCYRLENIAEENFQQKLESFARKNIGKTVRISIKLIEEGSNM